MTGRRRNDIALVPACVRDETERLWNSVVVSVLSRLSESEILFLEHWIFTFSRSEPVPGAVRFDEH